MSVSAESLKAVFKDPKAAHPSFVDSSTSPHTCLIGRFLTAVAGGDENAVIRTGQAIKRLIGGTDEVNIITFFNACMTSTYGALFLQHEPVVLDENPGNRLRFFIRNAALVVQERDGDIRAEQVNNAQRFEW